MHKLLRILLVLALVTGQSAAHAHALSHLAHDLASARWQAFMSPGQHLHGHGNPSEELACGHDHTSGAPELDHDKDRCAAFSALDNTAGSTLAAKVAGIPPVVAFVKRLWQFLAFERIPFSSRAPPVIS